jgi:hypothetical protein
LFTFLSTRVPMIHGCSAAYSPALRAYFGAVWGDLEDLVACFRTLAIGKLFYINRPLIKYRRHGDNATFFKGGEALRSFENRERRLRRGNEMTVRSFDNIIADMEILVQKGRILPREYSLLKTEAQRIQNPFRLESKMMDGSMVRRIQTLASTMMSGDFAGFLRVSPRGLPRSLYRSLYLLRERIRTS